MPPRRRKLLAALTLLLSTSGCFPARYLTQAATGELAMLTSARPIDDVLRDGTTPGRTKRLLGYVPAIKRFGQQNGLEPTRNYERYSDLKRPAAVWVVQGCAPLSFEVRRWTFPIVGSVPYLGFFQPAEAKALAESLAKSEGIDTDVRTASAYSTLGFFRDPVLSTMLPPGDEALGELANTVLHESVHATVYVSDQSAFNESLASFVADRLTPVWLTQLRGANASETKAWLAAEARYEKYVRRMHETYEALDALYGSTKSDAEKASAKATLLEGVKKELGIRGTLNNATLAGFRTYDTGATSFEKLFESCGEKWPRFLAAIRSLKKGDFEEAQQEDFSSVIETLAARPCPEPSSEAREGTAL